MAKRNPEHSAKYKRYIASPAWAKKRNEYFRANGRVCRACRSTEYLNVHHLSYENLEHEPLDDLACLCETCHNLVHSLCDATDGDLRDVTIRFIKDARKSEMEPAGKTAAPKKKRPRQSKRLMKFNKRLVPMCLAKKDKCQNPAPSGSGYCWVHDRTLETSPPSSDNTLPRVQEALARDALVRQKLRKTRR